MATEQTVEIKLPSSGTLRGMFGDDVEAMVEYWKTIRRLAHLLRDIGNRQIQENIWFRRLDARLYSGDIDGPGDEADRECWQKLDEIAQETIHVMNAHSMAKGIMGEDLHRAALCIANMVHLMAEAKLDREWAVNIGGETLRGRLDEEIQLVEKHLHRYTQRIRRSVARKLEQIGLTPHSAE